MKRKHFSIDQLVAILKQEVADLIRKVGISDVDLLPLEETVRRSAVGPGPFAN
ncbi:hypothetical protein [Crenobacter oryzisoli]|uniref:hypothetical protein n=1 Tax=Crenobacter oryzisoli TaxID=3056844 RepID=UPI003F49B1BA